MGSAASFQQDSQQQLPLTDAAAISAVPVSVKNDVIGLHNTLKRLVEQALAPGETQKFFKSCTSSQIPHWLENILPDIEPPHDDNVDPDLLKQTTRSLTMTALKGILDASHEDDVEDPSKHLSELPQELQEFEPLTIDEQVKSSAKNLGKQVQRKLHRQVCDVEQLKSIRSNVDTLSKNMSAVVEKRCRQKDVVKLCETVISAANNNFANVYTAVWDRIKDSDATGLKQYNKTVNAAAVSASTQEVQPASHPVDLVQEAAKVKPEYDQIMRAIVRSVQSSEGVGDGDIALNIPYVRRTHLSFELHAMFIFVVTIIIRCNVTANLSYFGK